MTYQNVQNLRLNRSKYLRISSKDRRNSSVDGTTDFTVSLDNNIDGIQNCKGFIVSHMSFPMALRTVINPVTFAINWKPHLLTSYQVSITIPFGNYTTTTLMTVIQGLLNTQLQAVIATNEISLTYVNERIVFTSTGSSVGTISIDQQNVQTDELLGIGNGQGDQGFISPITLINHPNLYGPKDIVICSNVLSDYTGTIETNGNFLSSICHVPITEVYGGYQIYRTNDIELNSIVYATSRNISSFDIQMKDDNGVIVDLQGLNWELTLKVYY